MSISFDYQDDIFLVLVNARELRQPFGDRLDRYAPGEPCHDRDRESRMILGAEQVVLFRGAGMGLHRRPEIAGLPAKAHETLQFKTNDSEALPWKFNIIEVVLAGLRRLYPLQEA
ncbi:hypothetical protein [Paracoccus benzoatiresistens]|uniref:Uncharacterized protein n=1 Tax=Paracoccus benzoatiresistens TaxID=2997341 RepID=A0ABT4JB70_9RHOB|nr:hypothetical protein [Paracoccus sp. EF6]MCZ0964300.1 hypothetical protein [Paracoccus sp. EF6]